MAADIIALLTVSKESALTEAGNSLLMSSVFHTGERGFLAYVLAYFTYKAFHAYTAGDA